MLFDMGYIKALILIYLLLSMPYHYLGSGSINLDNTLGLEDIIDKFPHDWKSMFTHLTLD